MLHVPHRHRVHEWRRYHDPDRLTLRQIIGVIVGGVLAFAACYVFLVVLFTAGS